jgi:hypothetical protein
MTCAVPPELVPVKSVLPLLMMIAPPAPLEPLKRSVPSVVIAGAGPAPEIPTPVRVTVRPVPIENPRAKGPLKFRPLRVVLDEKAISL